MQKTLFVCCAMLVIMLYGNECLAVDSDVFSRVDVQEVIVGVLAIAAIVFICTAQGCGGLIFSVILLFGSVC